MNSVFRALTPRGRLTFNTPLGPRTWFRTGGPAEALCIPKDMEDLTSIRGALPPEIPVTVLGACSNVIIRDGGIDGFVIRLAGAFAHITILPGKIEVGAAALDTVVAETAAQAGLTGLEFLAGIPGTIGGAVAMNAGAYGSDMAAILDWVDVLLPSGEILKLSHEALHFSYRHALLPKGGIILRACLNAMPEDATQIRARIAAIKASREASQPVRARTGGSTFRNPDGHKAWKLIDDAGGRGMVHGGAQVSEKHCNFLINRGNATSEDLETLGEIIRRRVQDRSGLILEWEIKRLGKTP